MPLSDLGRGFMDEFILALCKLIVLRRLHKSACHPQTDGFVERVRRSLMKCNSEYS